MTDLKNIIGFKDFESFEEFFEWIKTLELKSILENDKNLALYFESKGWSWSQRGQLANYIKDLSVKEHKNKVEEIRRFDEQGE